MKIEPFTNLPIKSGATNYRDLQNAIGKFDYINSLMKIQRFGKIFFQQTGKVFQVDTDFNLVDTGGCELKIFRDFVSFLAKEIILNCTESQKVMSDKDLMELAYLYGKLETDLDHLNPDNGNAWHWVLRNANHQWFFQRIPALIIGRYYYIYKQLLVDTQFSRLIISELGFSLIDILKIGTCIYANFIPRDSKPGVNAFSIENYINTEVVELAALLNKERLSQYLELFSITQNDFKTKTGEFMLDDELLKKYEFNALKRFPFIQTNSQIEPEKFIIPSLSDFIFSFSEGLYYVLLDKLSDSNKEILFQKIGQIFEHYIGELLKYYKVEDSQLRTQILPEQEYDVHGQDWKTADWIIHNNEYIIQVECKKRKLNIYDKAGVDIDSETGISNTIKIVGKELKKMFDKVEHIKAGQVNDIQYTGQKFINIIVFLDEMFAFNQYARKAIKDEIDLSDDNFFIFGSYEFEMVLQYMNDNRKDFISALDDYNDKRIEVYKIDFIWDKYEEFYKSILN